jgi:hypothetical protein
MQSPPVYKLLLPKLPKFNEMYLLWDEGRAIAVKIPVLFVFWSLTSIIIQDITATHNIYWELFQHNKKYMKKNHFTHSAVSCLYAISFQ